MYIFFEPWYRESPSAGKYAEAQAPKGKNRKIRTEYTVELSKTWICGTYCVEVVRFISFTTRGDLVHGGNGGGICIARVF